MTYIVRFPRSYETVLDELCTLRRDIDRRLQDKRKVPDSMYAELEDLAWELDRAAIREKIVFVAK